MSCRSLFALLSFSCGHCVVCSSSINGFWLPLRLWYLQTLLMSLVHGPNKQTGNHCSFKWNLAGMALAYPISKLVLHVRTTLHLLDFNLYLRWLYLSGDRHVGVVWMLLYNQISHSSWLNICHDINLREYAVFLAMFLNCTVQPQNQTNQHDFDHVDLSIK